MGFTGRENSRKRGMDNSETLKKSDIWYRAEVTEPCDRKQINRDRFNGTT